MRGAEVKCAEAARAERALTEDLAAIRALPVPAVDVRRRVARAIAGLRPADIVPLRSLAWAAACACACAVLLAASLGWIAHELRGLAREMAALGSGLGPLATAIADTVMPILAALARVAVNLAAAAAALLRAARPALETLLLLATLLMAATVTALVARDFRSARPVEEPRR